MCGIVGYIGEKPAVPVILEGLRRLEYRGYDSAGIAVAGNGHGMQIRRAAGKLHNLEVAVNSNPLDGSYGIGHTRWATHGPPSENNAHPHGDCTGRIVVVHNGIIENYASLKTGSPARRSPVRYTNRHRSDCPPCREIPSEKRGPWTMHD
jgi:glutamine---fructose-6-phosphate transaminase (isomerizing)